MPSSGADIPRRLFVALAVPFPVRHAVERALAAIAPELRPRLPSGQPTSGAQQAGGLRWVRPDAWHLTLTFLGAVEPRRVPDLEVRLGRAAGRGAPLSLRLAGAGRFGRHVLWAGVDGDRDGVRRLAVATGAAARRAGIDADNRPYRPHLTLARADGSSDLRALAAALADLASPPWTADELHLVQSHLGEGPDRTARHEVVARWPLGR
jgi:2'-5' RNA ligase